MKVLHHARRLPSTHRTERPAMRAQNAEPMPAMATPDAASSRVITAGILSLGSVRAPEVEAAKVVSSASPATDSSRRAGAAATSAVRVAAIEAIPR